MLKKNARGIVRDVTVFCGGLNCMPNPEHPRGMIMTFETIARSQYFETYQYRYRRVGFSPPIGRKQAKRHSCVGFSALDHRGFFFSRCWLLFGRTLAQGTASTTRNGGGGVAKPGLAPYESKPSYLRTPPPEREGGSDMQDMKVQLPPVSALRNEAQGVVSEKKGWTGSCRLR